MQSTASLSTNPPPHVQPPSTSTTDMGMQSMALLSTNAPQQVQPPSTSATDVAKQSTASLSSNAPQQVQPPEPKPPAAAEAPAAQPQSENVSSADKVESAASDAGKEAEKSGQTANESKDEEKSTKEKEPLPPAQSLSSMPEPEWEQHKPGPNDETITPKEQLPPRPEWYKKDIIHDVERSLLPEWFDSSAPHRTPETYLKAREKIIEMSDKLANRNVTNAMIRRVVVGDAGSLQRLRSFLVNWGIINEDAINDSTPTPASLRVDLKRPQKFNEDMRGNLILAVVQQAKRRKLNDYDGDHDMGVASSSSSFIPIDWEEVANKVGHGASAEDCQKAFMMETLKDEGSPSIERPITPDATHETSKTSSDPALSKEGRSPDQTKDLSHNEFVRDLVERSDPQVLKEVFDAAMKATGGNLVESQAASVLGLQLTRNVEEARGHEVDLAARLSKLVDVRMQKLENRMAMMEDVEAILEAEKVALELERRDLYTARCRHWFGGV
mmetsp:Transcript_6467/g.10084  ORF Transcript_6467/g.10084 Transcript_6467/m.10084 type:complete len:498 (+) Transcript_6467:2-1495(+)